MATSAPSRVSRVLIFLSLAGSAFLLPRSASGFACLWDGSSSTAWTTAANWSTCNSTTPQPGDTVTINSGGNQPTLSSGSASVGQVTVNSGATLTIGSGGALTLTNGLTGDGNLTVNSGGTLNWNGGIMNGAGTTAINSGGTLNLGSSYGQLQRAMTSAGTTNCTASGYIYLISPGTYTNSGTFNISNDYYGWYGDGTTTVNNSGTVVRNTSSGKATIYQVKFVNTGNVNVTTGTLDLSTVMSSTHSGDFNVSSGATLQFSGGATNTFNGDITGTGTATAIFSGGIQTLNGGYTVPNTTISGATVNFNQASTVNLTNLTMNSGTLAGSADVNLTNNVDLNSGAFKGAGKVTFAAGGPDMAMDSSYIQVERPVFNARTITFLGTAYFYVIGTGSFTNQAAGVLDIQNDYYGLYGDGTTTATNTGTVKRTASSGKATLYNVKFTNTNPGTVSVQSGTLEVQSGGTTNNGAYTVASGAILQLTGGGTNAISGPISGAGAVSFGGTYNLTGTYSISNTTITSGTINFNQASPQTFANLRMDSGTLAGSAAITVSNGADFNAGTLAGNALFTLAAGSNSVMDSSYIAVQRPVRNAGTVTQQASSYFYVTSPGSFQNQATGTVEIQNDYYGWYGDTTTTLTNAGTISRTTSSGTATITSMKTTNTGTINAQSGTLAISGGQFTQTDGALHLNGGNLTVYSIPLNIQGGVLDGNGIINGNVSVSGSGHFNPGTSPGEISLTGSSTYTQAAPGVLNIEINGPDPGFDYDDVLIGGAANLGGELHVTLGFTPSVGQSFTILKHASRTGTFTTFTAPSPGAGRGWDLSYTATETKLTVTNMLPGGLNVDSRSAAGTQSDANGVLEPGERVVVEPTWANMAESPVTLTATASNFTGPAATGVSYTLNDSTADYGTANADTTTNCFDATGNCYQVQITGGALRPEARPATHWDTTVHEAGSGGTSKTWTLHVGDSFTDVPRDQLFYKRIETLLHTGITAGCTATTYCPTQQVSRGQMAIFVARGLAGGSANVPVSGTVGNPPKPYNCVAGPGGASIFSDVAPTDIYCRHIHYIAAQNVTLGCSATQYCPGGSITRLEMAAFIAKAIVAPAGGPGVPLAYGPDPVTGFSYNCNGANIHFGDVPASNPFCKHVHFLWARGIASGTSPTNFGPGQVVTRDAMARFLSNAFNLLLYGPVP